MHTPSAKGPTQNCYSSYSSVRFVEASFPDRGKNYIKYLHTVDLKNNVVITFAARFAKFLGNWKVCYEVAK